MNDSGSDKPVDPPRTIPGMVEESPPPLPPLDGVAVQNLKDIDALRGALTAFSEEILDIALEPDALTAKAAGVAQHFDQKVNRVRAALLSYSEVHARDLPFVDSGTTNRRMIDELADSTIANANEVVSHGVDACATVTTRMSGMKADSMPAEVRRQFLGSLLSGVVNSIAEGEGIVAGPIEGLHRVMTEMAHHVQKVAYQPILDAWHAERRRKREVAEARAKAEARAAAEAAKKAMEHRDGPTSDQDH